MTSIRTTNNKRLEALRQEIDKDGISAVARKYKVNHYYISMIYRNEDYVPKSEHICFMLGLETYRVSVPHGTQPPKPKRVTIYPGTPVDKIKRRLREVTGIEWQPMIDETEY